MSWVIAKKETLSEKEVEQTLRAQDAIAKAVRRVEQQFAKKKLTKKARWGESGFWLSPDGVLTNFPYPSTQHAEAIDEGLLQLPPQLQQQLEDSGTPVEDLIKHGWTRGIVNSDEVYVEVADESHVSPSLSRLPFLAPKLLVDIFNNPNGYFALMLNEGEDLESAWRNRNRPRVFASNEASGDVAEEILSLIDELGGEDGAAQALQQLEADEVVAFDIDKAARLALLLMQIGISAPVFISNPAEAKSKVEQKVTETVEQQRPEFRSPVDFTQWGLASLVTAMDAYSVAELASQQMTELPKNNDPETLKERNKLGAIFMDCVSYVGALTAYEKKYGVYLAKQGDELVWVKGTNPDITVLEDFANSQ